MIPNGPNCLSSRETLRVEVLVKGVSPSFRPFSNSKANHSMSPKPTSKVSLKTKRYAPLSTCVARALVRRSSDPSKPPVKRGWAEDGGLAGRLSKQLMADGNAKGRRFALRQHRRKNKELECQLMARITENTSLPTGIIRKGDFSLAM